MVPSCLFMTGILDSFINLAQHAPASLKKSRTFLGSKNVCTFVVDAGIRSPNQLGGAWKRGVGESIPPEKTKRFPPRLYASWKQLERRTNRRLGQKGDICSCRLWRDPKAGGRVYSAGRGIRVVQTPGQSQRRKASRNTASKAAVYCYEGGTGWVPSSSQILGSSS